MKSRFRLYRRRGSVYYCFDRQDGKQSSLGTTDKTEAQRLLNVKNEAYHNPQLNRRMALTYLEAVDPMAAKRAWRYVFEELIKTKYGENADRWRRAIKDKAYKSIIDLPLLETRSEHFLAVIHAGKVSTNVFLRRLHNFALGMGWLHLPVLPPKQWPKITHKRKRAITEEEHNKIIAGEVNSERRAYYQLMWELGGSQGDVAKLNNRNIDWENRTLGYDRKKTGQGAGIRFDDEVEKLLHSRPSEGPLFPYLSTVRASDRATEFKQRCQGLGIEGITLHSYRFSWAERAKAANYPERAAQEVLGHGSKAVHRFYARNIHADAMTIRAWKTRQGNNVVPVEFKKEPADAQSTGSLASTTAKS